MNHLGLEDRGKESLERQSSHQSIYSFGLQAVWGWNKRGLTGSAYGVSLDGARRPDLGQNRCR